MKTYLGKRGYIIYKKEFEFDKLQEIRDELTVKPYVPEDYKKSDDESFKIYAENKNKMYLPKFYGVEKFGPPDELRIPRGLDANLDFVGTLRPNQIEPYDATMKALNNYGGGILSLPCGYGKCLGKDTPIIMYDGSVKMVQDIKVGDKLMGDDSKPRNVLSLARGKEKLYKVIPKKGDSYIVNESHILSLKCATNHSQKYKKNTVVDMCVKDWLNLPKSYHGKGGVLYGYRVPVSFDHKRVEVDPYFLGLWLGDGNSRTTSITTINSEIEDYLTEYAKKEGMNIRRHDRNNIGWELSTEIGKSNHVLQKLKELNLIENKHIPMIYKCNDREVQLNVLAGLIDSDGSLQNPRCYDIVKKNEKLLDDIIYIARSLGFAAYKKECKKSCIYKGEKREGTYYRTIIHGPGIEEIPVKVKRKMCNSERKQVKDVLKTRITVVEHEEEGDYYGFTIDGNHRFLLGDFQVTHNTALSLFIASKFKLKTLVIVHKTFLLNQWKDRIKEFMPNAKIGTIQQKTVDTEDKDIVIGMLQSISMKDYAMTTFDCFGMLIIDECHRISSKVYSRALRKTNSTYMLALSATPTRKDGLTKVLKWHVGDIVYSVKRKGGDGVNVERYIINSDNEGYTNELLNFRGKPNMPKMINNITEYMNRTLLIINRIKDLIKEDRRILLLSDRRNHLADIFKIVEKQNICSVGYYVGGMKEKDLKISSEMELILGTFSMANEGLDIPALNTLILASPKSDIIQATGRILRKDHIDIKPLIIDYVDNFSMFAGQARKRYKYFQGKKYNITNIEITDQGDIISKSEYKQPQRKSRKKIETQLNVDKNCLFSNFNY